ncbi:hypothetical protein [Mechercharimyces sp. CAU 1602]|uniref:hypothetical protein n=1 Tax=Mechercharimyces sp. CAU 1602 TaxID=2973933 RepID=UPI0021614DCC|nr:hypothetical protein [Mechercharimyces sp. CAU 1602]MCS1350754.1 hypothetical protein [Mechercharimyces sp. CAU 1602]
MKSSTLLFSTGNRIIKNDDFSIGKKEREELYQSGVEAAEAFFAEFSFSSYLAVRGKKSRLSYRLQAGKRDFDE